MLAEVLANFGLVAPVSIVVEFLVTGLAIWKIVEVVKDNFETKKK